MASDWVLSMGFIPPSAVTLGSLIKDIRSPTSEYYSSKYAEPRVVEKLSSNFNHRQLKSKNKRFSLQLTALVSDCYVTESSPDKDLKISAYIERTMSMTYRKQFFIF